MPPAIQQAVTGKSCGDPVYRLARRITSAKEDAEEGIDLLRLAARWGAFFLSMRVAAPESGPVLLIEIRVAVAALFLLP